MSLAISPSPIARLAASAARPGPRAPAAETPSPAGGAPGDSYEASVVPPDGPGWDVLPGEAADEGAAGDAATRGEGRAQDAGDDEARTGGSQQLSADQRRMITELQARDRAVRAHEAAHQAAGGGVVGGASYSYQQGPDGRQYAVGGEVPVDLSTSGSSPEAVIAKMARVRAAAMAPADPSPQDFAVAAAAAAIEAAVRQAQRTSTVEEAAPADQGRAAAAGQTAAAPTATPPADGGRATTADGPAAEPAARAVPGTPATDAATGPSTARRRQALAAYRAAGTGAHQA